MFFAKSGYISRRLRSLKAALIGPQIFAFLPALTLGAMWYGGEGLLLYMALIFPALFAAAGLLNSAGIGTDGKDAITGLALRRVASQRLDFYLDEQNNTGKSSAAFAIELDHFADIERQFGPRAAGKIFAQSAQRITSILRDTDLTVHLNPTRIGVVTAPMRRSDLEMLIQLAARIQSAVSEPLSIDASSVHVTASVGFCSEARAHERTGTSMLSCAEDALSAAQLNGAGSIRAYSAETKRKSEARGALPAEITEALENGQIETWLQPQISTDTGDLTGFEAVPRWNHPERGMLTEAEFEDAIQQNGLSERLREVVLFTALTAIKGWDDAGLNIPKVSVNFSGQEMSNPKIADKIKWELDRFGLTADRLAIEIHEQVIANVENDTIVANIAALTDFGCLIDLDDFGTGHASIANIRRFAVNRIKIDRSFVTRVDRDREQQNMVAAVLTMAERLNLETLAEGVETLGEHAMLAQLGCQNVQGFSVSGPLPFSETQAWIVQHRAKLTTQPEFHRKSS